MEVRRALSAVRRFNSLCLIALAAAATSGCASKAWVVSSTSFVGAPMPCNQVAGYGLADTTEGNVWGGGAGPPDPDVANSMVRPNDRMCAVGSVTIRKTDPNQAFDPNKVSMYVTFAYRYPNVTVLRWLRYDKPHNGANQVTFERVIFAGAYTLAHYDALKAASTPQGVQVRLGQILNQSELVVQYGDTDEKDCRFYPASNLYPACP